MSIWLGNEKIETTEELVHELTPTNFDKRYGTSWSGGDHRDLLFLDNGAVVDRSTWNGEMYLDGHYMPAYDEIEEDVFEIVGYKEM